MIPVNEPVLSAEAKKNVIDCLDSGWISSSGSYIKKFEENFAKYIGVSYATTTTNGTTALHLALTSLGIGVGDEVIIPNLTIISCAVAVLYTGAIPVFVDVQAGSGGLDPLLLEASITKKTKAIMVVHLYGHPADMDSIMAIAKKHNLLVIEDAAEAHGALYKGKKVGSIGDVGCFSFYANKIITTGEGGMVVTNNKELYEKANLLKNLAHSPHQRFVHEEVGFNYRMTNMQAALGVGELEHIDEYIEKKCWIAAEYNKRLGNIPFLELPHEESWAKSVYWMYAVLLTNKSPISKDQFRSRLLELGCDTRDYFYPLHRQPVFRSLHMKFTDTFPVSVDLSARGLYLPSGLAITQSQIESVCASISTILNV